MHELSVAHAIVSTVVEALPEDAPRVLEVRVRIGVLSGVVPAALDYAYDVAAQGTRLADAALHIERAAVVIHCARCHAARTLASTTDFTCPECGTPSGNVIDGKDMEIVSIVLEDEPAVVT